MRRTPLKRSKTPLKRSRLRVNGVSDVSSIKREIQALLRELVILRDGGCVLRFSPETGQCSDILQAEHLISRANSKFYADPRNIVCLCQRHHIFWKPQNSRLYWQLIAKVIGDQRQQWLELAEQDKTPCHKNLSDWKIDKAVLQQEIRRLKEHATV